MLTFKAFLSHRYKSPATNIFFFRLFAQTANVQFEVDEGISYQPVGGGEIVKKVPTNVTRLERMLRGADAFIGIYPLSLPTTDAPLRRQLLEESRYFRLELDLAVRSRKPAFVAYDERYKSLLDCPADVFRCSFDAQEIASGIQAPSLAAFKKTFADFCNSVGASMAYRATRGAAARSGKVGVLLPPPGAQGGGYEADHVHSIEVALADANYEAVRLPWPPIVGRELLIAAAALDWSILDVGDAPGSAATVAFLHGQTLATMRLRRVATAEAGPSALEQTLYGSLDVGYPKDIIRWQTPGDLEAGVRARIQVIDLPPKRINTAEEAEAYFSKVAQRPVNVFLSYSGKDEAVAAGISKALKQRFSKVFDYKDGVSIRPGEPWLKEIFDQLSTAAVAIPLISANYFDSGNCEHEAHEIVALQDNRQLHVVPVKLSEKIDVPPWFRATQFERLFASTGNIESLMDEIVSLVDSRQKEVAAGGK